MVRLCTRLFGASTNKSWLWDWQRRAQDLTALGNFDTRILSILCLRTTILYPRPQKSQKKTKALRWRKTTEMDKFMHWGPGERLQPLIHTSWITSHITKKPTKCHSAQGLIWGQLVFHKALLYLEQWFSNCSHWHSTFTTLATYTYTYIWCL